MKRVRIGDVVEIRGQKGSYFAHYVLRQPGWGPLLWFFGKPWPDAPDDLRLTVSGVPTLIAFFPLAGSAGKLEFVRIAGNIPVPPDRAKLPLFKNGVEDPATGRVENWWLWDGEREWLVGRLSREQENLPQLQAINVAYFLELLGDGAGKF
jgi:hypothetical protein